MDDNASGVFSARDFLARRPRFAAKVSTYGHRIAMRINVLVRGMINGDLVKITGFRDGAGFLCWGGNGLLFILWLLCLGYNKVENPSLMEESDPVSRYRVAGFFGEYS